VPTLAPARTHPERRATPAGFTLIEMLTVMAVIAILVAMVLVMGRKVMSGQRANQTQNILVALDRALDEYFTVVGSMPPYNPDDYEDVPGESNGPQVYQSAGKHCARPDAAVFLRQVQGFGEVDAIVTGIGDRFLRQTLNTYAIANPGDSAFVAKSDPTPSVVDAWAPAGWPNSDAADDVEQRKYDIADQQVIYYVHPENPLAQDLYGQCINGRPYFMSAGPDKQYGLRNEGVYRDSPRSVEEAEAAVEDNIYSYRVGPIKRGMPAPARAWNPE
jgi:prepilin-type N-terminal cleavage/methylation domain-containing protein